MFDEFRKAAISATLNIFETMFFTFLDLIVDERATEEPLRKYQADTEFTFEVSQSLILKTEIPFSGKHSGILRLFLPYELGETLAMNFLGFEEEVTESQIFDMASELANMICGNMFSHLDKTAVYNLGSPITKKMTFNDALEGIPPADIALNFLTEGQKATIQLQIDPNP
jgi:hypothetical protein